jgi:hypothetical protein
MPSINLEYRQDKFHVIVYQTNKMRYPLVAVNTDRNGAKFEITEKKYLYKKSKLIKSIK